jgi:hypothetical protein
VLCSVELCSVELCCAALNYVMAVMSSYVVLRFVRLNSVKAVKLCYVPLG